MTISANVRLETVLACPAERAWAEVKKPGLLIQIVKPLLTLTAVDPPAFPTEWPRGRVLKVRGHLFGLLPLGSRRIVFEEIDDARHELCTYESDWLFRAWSHRVVIERLDANRARYVDDVVIEAGALTPLLRPFVAWFCRNGQRQLRMLARQLALD